MANWYLLRNGVANGPYPEEQVRDWIRSGQLAPDEKLNREGDPNWLSVDMIPEFATDKAAPAAGSVPFVPPTAGYGATTPGVAAPKDRMVAGILALLLGWLGIHHFYLGNTTTGIIYLAISLCSGTTIGWVLGIVDGIIYLTKPDDQFQRNYKNWFCSGT
jgi:TM2 domain-containing membrane protein YozV